MITCGVRPRIVPVFTTGRVHHPDDIVNGYGSGVGRITKGYLQHCKHRVAACGNPHSSSQQMQRRRIVKGVHFHCCKRWIVVCSYTVQPPSTTNCPGNACHDAVACGCRICGRPVYHCLRCVPLQSLSFTLVHSHTNSHSITLDHTGSHSMPYQLARPIHSCGSPAVVMKPHHAWMPFSPASFCYCRTGHGW